MSRFDLVRRTSVQFLRYWRFERSASSFGGELTEASAELTISSIGTCLFGFFAQLRPSDKSDFSPGEETCDEKLTTVLEIGPRKINNSWIQRSNFLINI